MFWFFVDCCASKRTNANEYAIVIFFKFEKKMNALFFISKKKIAIAIAIFYYYAFANSNASVCR